MLISIIAKPPATSSAYFLVNFLLRVCDIGGVCIIELTFFSMLRSRVEQLEKQSGSSKTSKGEGGKETGEEEELSTPLMGETFSEGDFTETEEEDLRL